MRAAIYRRRSREDHQAESLATQLDGARRLIAERGWVEVAVYEDDGISRAEFRRRPGLVAMLNGAAAGAFDVVVTRDESRMGGDMVRTTLVIQDLIDRGVRLFYYATREEVRLDDATARLVAVARNFGAELEREKISSRTREHLERKARRGLVAGGVTYGYDNARSLDGVRRAVNPKEAEVVREIFARAARGEGYRTIAHALNAQGVPPPRARGGGGSWAPGTIREMLRRSVYAGIQEWGKTHKAYRSGTKVRLDAHPNPVLRVPAPELRIISNEVWEAVQERNAQYLAATGGSRLEGRRPTYLLSGISRCAVCGGAITVDRVKVSYEQVRGYGCGWRRDRGPSVCSNSLRRPMTVVDAAFCAWLREHVLSERVVRVVVRAVEAALATDRAEPAEERVEAEVRRLRGELARLVSAIASASGPVDVLVAAVEEREGRVRALEGQRRASGRAREALGRGNLEFRIRGRLGQLQELLSARPAEGRRVVQSILRGPLTWSPTQTADGWRYTIRGEATLGTLLVTEGHDGGVKLASPAGFDLCPIALELAA